MKLVWPAIVLCLALTLGACQANEPARQPVTPTPTPKLEATPAPSATPAADKTTDKAAAEFKETPSGLQYQDLVVGTGPRPLLGQTARLLYTGWTLDGVKFDGNADGNKPVLELKLGKGEVIKGWEIGVGGGRGIDAMRVGGKRKLRIPPELGYGPNPMGTIPPNSTLLFEIELIGVKGGGMFGGR